MVNNKLKTIFGMFLITTRYNNDLTCLKRLILPFTQERVDESEHTGLVVSPVEILIPECKVRTFESIHF